MDESTLLKSARDLDRAALVAIFDAYAPRVFRYTFRLCLDSVQSDRIVGEVFAQFLENIANGHGPLVNLKAYLFQITFQKIIEEMDDKSLIMKAVAPDTGSKTASTITPPSREEWFLSQILSALNKDLSAVQRHVLLLRYLEEFSLNETALIVGKSVSNVKVIQNRALTRLRRQLDSHLDGGQQGLALEPDS